MKEMKTLTINGESYAITDDGAIRFSNEQSLTPEQQAQARANIGAAAPGEGGGGGADEKAIIEKLAPVFTKKGEVVTCNPVEGYPLEVVSQLTDSAVNLIPDDAGFSIEEYSDPTVAVELPAGKYRVCCDCDSTIDVASQDWENVIGTIPGGQPGELVVTHSGGTLFLIDRDMIGANAELYEVKDRHEFTSVTLTHNGETITAEFPEAVPVGSFNWSSGVLRADAGNPNLIPVDLGDMSNWGTDEATGLPAYEISLPDGTYTLSVKAKDDGKVLYVEVLDYGEWCNHATVQTGGYVTFELYGENHGYYNCTIRLLDSNGISVDSEFIAVKLEAGSKFTGFPIKHQLTPREILGKPGTNTLKSNFGDTEVSGRADPAAAFAEQEARIAALEAALLNG